MVATNYVWDGQQYLTETDGSNTTQAVWTNEPDDYTNLISQRRGGATQYPHFDALGSTRQLTDANENITDRLLYDAWGNVLAHAGVTIFPLQFVGMFGYYFDADTNTVCIIERIYEPDTGRWYSVDPLSYTFIRLTLTAYQYASNSPLTSYDPSGLLDLIIAPKTPDSMDWYRYSARARGLEVARTSQEYKLAFDPVQRNPETKKCRVRFKVTLEMRIEIDEMKLKGLARTRKGLTLQAAYAHEQAHVKNMITIIERERAILEAVEKKEFDTVEEAIKARDDVGKLFDQQIKKALNDEKGHKGKDPKSPGAGNYSLAPIGTMPKDPKEPMEQAPKESMVPREPKGCSCS